MTFWEYLDSRAEDLLIAAEGHFRVVGVSVGIAVLVGTAVGLLTYRKIGVRNASVGIAAILFTVPPFGLLSLLIAPVGLGFKPSVIALIMYALLPIVRNTVVGLAGIEPFLVESARAMGMSRTRTLFTVELPLAWPVILAGIRVATQIAIGVAAVAAYVGCPGFGNLIFQGLSNLGGVNSFNSALAGTLGVVAVALTVDALLAVVRRLTTPLGVRA